MYVGDRLHRESPCWCGPRPFGEVNMADHRGTDVGMVRNPMTVVHADTRLVCPHWTRSSHAEPRWTRFHITSAETPAAIVQTPQCGRPTAGGARTLAGRPSPRWRRRPSGVSNTHRWL